MEAYNHPRYRMLILDCDGTLTDGSIIYSDNGAETKAFSAKDGLGLRLAALAGMEIAVVTGRASDLLVRRCADLHIRHLFQKVHNKLDVCTALLKQMGIDWSETAVMGDDWNDYPILRKAGLSGLPADGTDDMKALVHYVSTSNGGQGAVRDFVDHILKAMGVYEETIAAFLRSLLADSGCDLVQQ